jgi:hypothetical protein
VRLFEEVQARGDQSVCVLASTNVQHAGLAQGTFENRPIREKATASRDK